MAFFTEERHEVSVETGNLGWGFHGCLKKTSLFLVNAKPKNSAFFMCWKEKQVLEKQRWSFVIHLIDHLNIWPLAFRGINLCFL